MPTLHELFADAVRHQQAGRLAEAGTIYRHILTYAPTHTQTWYALGVVTHQSGDYAGSAEAFERALASNPDWAEALSNLGLALLSLGKPDEAAARCRRAVELQPNLVEAHYALGRAW